MEMGSSRLINGLGAIGIASGAMQNLRLLRGVAPKASHRTASSTNHNVAYRTESLPPLRRHLVVQRNALRCLMLPLHIARRCVRFR
jgi:hypothetical protein